MSDEASGEPRGIYRHFPALAERNFRLFIIGQIISLTGTWMQTPALKWVVYDITKSRQALGTVDFLSQLPVTVLVMAAGVFVDRHSRLRIVIFTQVCLTLAAFAFGVFAQTGHLTIMVIYTVVILSGIAQAFDVPARQSFIMEMAGRKSLGNAIAVNSATFNSARVIGPSVGALVLAAVGAMWCFYLNALSYLAVLWALFSMKDLHLRRIEKSKEGFKDLLDGMRYVRAHPHIMPLLMVTAMYGLFGNYFTTLLPTFAKDIYHANEFRYGLLFSAIGIGAATGAVRTAIKGKSDRWERRTVVGLFLAAITTVGLSVATNYYVAFALTVVLGFGMMSFLVCSNTLIQHLAAPQYVGRVISVRHFVFGGMFPFGALIAGFAAQRVGPQWTVAGSGAMLLVAFFALGPKVLRISLPEPGAAEEVSQANGEKAADTGGASPGA